MKSHVDKDYEGGALTPDQDRALILGDHLLVELEIDPGSLLSRLILASLDQSLTDPHERALFNLSPKLDYDDRLRPFKPPRLDPAEAGEEEQ